MICRQRWSGNWFLLLSESSLVKLMAGSYLIINNNGESIISELPHFALQECDHPERVPDFRFSHRDLALGLPTADNLNNFAGVGSDLLHIFQP